MANIASQIKRNRQAITARDRNKAVRTNLKTQLKRFRAAADAGDRAAAQDAYQFAARRLDKAVTKGVVHPNYAANKKSRMAKAVRAL